MMYSEKVVKLLEAKGISGYRLAKDIGALPNAGTNWVANNQVPYKYALEIADYFEVDVRSLLDSKMEVVTLNITE